jgi:CheY-like chemotaxis protein
MKSDSKQNIWVAAERVGVVKINKQRKIKRYGSRHGLPDYIMINGVWIDNTDSVWVGTSQGVFFMAGNENRFVSIVGGKLPTLSVRKIYVGTKKILYLGSTFNGVYVYENKKKQWKNYRAPGESGANNVFALKEDHRGRLLIGTLAGLFILDPEQERLNKFKENNFEIHNPVYFIIEDHRRRLWFGTNAAHAMREKGGILDISLDEVILDAETVKKYQDIKPGIYLRLTVSDTGHGMSGKVMKHIFEPYFTTKETGEGTGMGMAVTHGIVKSCGGDISVTSESGKGTTFYVLFPKIEEKEEPEKELKETIPGGSERVLLVDDETSLIDAGTQVLKRLGYDAVGITDAITALETVRKDPDRFHLVISDLTMPQITGIQLAEEIKKIKPDIPIILCSGFSASLTPEQIKALGIDDFITKPFIRRELAQVIRRVLDRKQ